MALNLTDIFKRDYQDDQEVGVEEESLLQSAVDSMDAGDSSLMTSSLDSQMSSHLDAAYAQPAGEEPTVTLPVLGTDTLTGHQRKLFFVLMLALLATAAGVFWVVTQSSKATRQLEMVDQAQTQVQRMAKSAVQSLTGNAVAFQELDESAKEVSAAVTVLREGGQSSDGRAVLALDESFAGDMETISQLVDRDSGSAAAIVGQQQLLTGMGAALGEVRARADEMLEVAEAVASLKQQQNAPGAEVAVANQLAVLSQRIARTSSELLSFDGAAPDAAMYQLSNYLNLFREHAQDLLNGNRAKNLGAASGDAVRERLRKLLQLHTDAGTQASAVVSNLQGLVAARDAQATIVGDSEPLSTALKDLRAGLQTSTGLGVADMLLFLVAAALAILSVGGLAYIPLLDSRQRHAVAEQQRSVAETLQQESKRVNDANQAAILRLMNELQVIAEGDLTQEATVTEDITGAIADSVNYTVEGLRNLVGNVQSTADRVVLTTSKVETTSSELLEASDEQLREIRATGQSVLDMAARINEVSAQAQESADVARQSLKAATTGLDAVQSTIGGMNAIRDQIQETSKRIKRLGESSQEIGEITELIADITEQTNVLALNAAIQAASAGEAGRGFSVVAEDVQRLAERSGDATRQIAALVKAIQTDTQDAVAAMERSTHGVVEGARLSDNAGTALTEIDRVTRRLAELIEKISDSAQKEAGHANNVAGNIQHIFAVTEQAESGTRTTATQVRDLARIADELRQSVSRFKISA
ncbi:MAG: methyl-accepting chemotaxis protein [Ottowia sp.]|nr:methyl-accepting chemotaxis protein [Ottowia sp.]